MIRAIEKHDCLRSYGWDSADKNEKQDVLDYINKTFDGDIIIPNTFNQTRKSPAPRGELRAEAAKKLAPARATESHNGWRQSQSISENVRPSKSTISRDSQDIDVVLRAVSQADPNQAALAISSLLNKPASKAVKQSVIANIISQDNGTNSSIESKIINSIKEFIAHHSLSKGGTRTLDAQEAMDTVATASVFGAVKNGISISKSAVSKTIGATADQIEKGFKRAHHLIVNNVPTFRQKRKRRKDYCIDELIKYLLLFLLDDDYTRLDTKQNLVEIKDPRTGNKIKVHKRIWKIVNRQSRLESFVASDHFQAFKEDCCFPRDSVSFATFEKAMTRLKKIVGEPLPSQD